MKLENDDIILDIGPKTIEKINNIIEKVKQFYGMVLQDILKIQILQKEVLKLEKKLQKEK